MIMSAPNHFQILAQLPRCAFRHDHFRKLYIFTDLPHVPTPPPHSNQDGSRLQIVAQWCTPQKIRMDEDCRSSLGNVPPPLKKSGWVKIGDHGPMMYPMDGRDFTTIQMDLIQMDDYPADSCVISPAAFLLSLKILSMWFNKNGTRDEIRGLAIFQLKRIFFVIYEIAIMLFSSLCSSCRSIQLIRHENVSLSCELSFLKEICIH